MNLLRRMQPHVRDFSHAAFRLASGRRHGSSRFPKLFACSLLAVSAISCAGPRYSDHVSSIVTSGLLSAEQALADGQLISPPEDNALVHLERVLAEDPGNRKAAQLLNHLIVRFAMTNDIAHAGQELVRLRTLHAVSSVARLDGGAAQDAEQTIRPSVSKAHVGATPHASYGDTPRRWSYRIYGTF